jgi:hypothetical protein
LTQNETVNAPSEAGILPAGGGAVGLFWVYPEVGGSIRIYPGVGR